MDTAEAAMATYERIAESIRDDIRSGALKPGDRLPTQRELVVKYGVAVATMQNALRLLQNEGWLTSRASVGVFVNDPPAGGSEPVTLAAVSRQVSELTATVADLAERLRKVEDQHDAP